MSRELKEKSIRWLLTGVAFVSLLSLACIMLFLFMEGLPLFADYPLWDFLTGHLWYPTSEPPEFGIFPLIMGSLAVTILASCIAVPLGIMTAAYLAEIAASRTRRIVKPFVELLAALPSVVIGFFGMVIVAPFLQDWFGADTGLNLLNAALMLAFMSVPTICSVAEDALFAVPRTLREASLALGATRWETLIRVVIPSRAVRHRYSRHARHVSGHRRNHGRAYGCRGRGPSYRSRFSIPCAPCPLPSPLKWRKRLSVAITTSPCSPRASCCSCSRSCSTCWLSASRKNTSKPGPPACRDMP